MTSFEIFKATERPEQAGWNVAVGTLPHPNRRGRQKSGCLPCRQIRTISWDGAASWPASVLCIRDSAWISTSICRPKTSRRTKAMPSSDWTGSG